MGDVSAVVLSLGEPSVERALASVQRQTLAPADVVIVEGVTPFHRAFNEAASRVRTDFFVQVDADMVLDETCFERLRACVAASVGLVVGRLRDSMIGRIVGIKLFRTECCVRLTLPASISPETDHIGRLHEAGWLRVDALRAGDLPRAVWHTLGEHAPDYENPEYVFTRHYVTAARSCYRGSAIQLRELFRRLAASPHPAAPLALLGVAAGGLSTETQDLPQPYQPGPEFERAYRFVRLDGNASTAADGLRIEPGVPADVLFRRFYAHGVRLGAAGAYGAFRDATLRLSQCEDRSTWVALLALGRGVLTGRDDDAVMEEDLGRLRALVT